MAASYPFLAEIELDFEKKKQSLVVCGRGESNPVLLLHCQRSGQWCAVCAVHRVRFRYPVQSLPKCCSNRKREKKTFPFRSCGRGESNPIASFNPYFQLYDEWKRCTALCPLSLLCSKLTKCVTFFVRVNRALPKAFDRGEQKI
jgi:hypothetical protein